MPEVDRHTDDSADARWRAMQAAVDRARQQPVAVMEAVGAAASREEAAAALGRLLAVDDGLADNLLDLRISDFL